MRCICSSFTSLRLSAAGGQDGDERTDPGGPTANQCSGTGCVIDDSAGQSAHIGAATAGHQHRGGVSRLARRPLILPSRSKPSCPSRSTLLGVARNAIV